MEYGLIGEKLTHSFSAEIHALIGDYSYELREIPKEKLQDFLTEKAFSAVNVTIPYKQAVLPFLSGISPEAEKIGAVNLIVNRNGKLFGYNTDYYGAKRLIERANVQVKGKKALILGSGGTRPHPNETPVDPALFPRLCGVIDVIYNPLRTDFTEKAHFLGVPAANGLYMLAAQAVKASAIMRGVALTDAKTDDLCETVYRKTLQSKQNIVLIGMPDSGKSTVGALLAKKTGRTLYDTDMLTATREGKTVREIFLQDGEKAFRTAEDKTVRDLSGKTGCIIATGGGTVLNAENVRLLKKNGKLFFLDRPLSKLSVGADRPLSSSYAALAAMYEKRLPLYLSAADERIANDGDAETAAENILNLL